MIEALISFSIASFFLALSPGPDNIYVLSQSLANGTKSGIATTLGLVSGCIVHTLLLAFGVSVLITKSETLFLIIKILGAFYLLFLAYKTYQNSTSISFSDDTPSKTTAQLFKQGVFMNLINPKVMLFFLAFFPGFLWNREEGTVIQFLILGLVFMSVSFLVFSSISLLAGKISGYLKNHKNFEGLLKWFQIIVFIGIALFILLP